MAMIEYSPLVVIEAGLGQIREAFIIILGTGIIIAYLQLVISV